MHGGDLGVVVAVSAVFAVMRAQFALVPDEAGEIVGEIGHADLGPGPCDADHVHEQAHAGFLVGKDVLDEGADLRAAAVGARHRLAHRPALWLLLVDV